MNAIRDLADLIGEDLDPDSKVVGFDIQIIIDILTQLAPLLFDCFPDESIADQATKACALCEDRGGFGYRWRRWRVQRVVAREMGGYTDHAMVRRVTKVIMRTIAHNPRSVESALGNLQPF